MRNQTLSLTKTTALIVAGRALVGLTFSVLENRTNSVAPPALVVTGPWLSLLLVASYGIARDKEWGVLLAMAVTMVTALIGILGALIALTVPNQFLPGPVMGIVLSLLLLAWLNFFRSAE